MRRRIMSEYMVDGEPVSEEEWVRLVCEYAGGWNLHEGPIDGYGEGEIRVSKYNRLDVEVSSGNGKFSFLADRVECYPDDVKEVNNYDAAVARFIDDRTGMVLDVWSDNSMIYDKYRR